MACRAIRAGTAMRGVRARDKRRRSKRGHSMTTKLWERLSGLSRRELFRRGGWLAATGALSGGARSAAAAPANGGGQISRAIGVQPIVNCRGTFTIITGSQTLPEVKRAMDEASRSYVQMDELMEGVGKRLAGITGAEWGIVTAGCCAALTHCAAAAVAGSI